MVYLSGTLLRIKTSELGKHLKLRFIDKLRIFVKSGTGGDGHKSLGGIGGDGGSVLIKATEGINLKDVYLKNLRKRYIAPNGFSSKRLRLNGDNGEDLIIQVPCGITALTDSGVHIGEVNKEDELLMIAKGGKGGSPMNGYKGEDGLAFSINLDLKLIADVGLIGFPNAGKSTLLSLVSRARPKIANYPFTTIIPQLGSIEYYDGRKITIADLPGLIEGAHVNRGKGHKFLKHIARTKINLFLIDINGFQLNLKSEVRSPFETLLILNKELEMYNRDLIERPSLLVLNKIDLDESNRAYDEFMNAYSDISNNIKNMDENILPTELVKFKKVLTISAKNNENVSELCQEIRDLIDESDDKFNPKEKVDDDSVESKTKICKTCLKTII